MGPSFGCATVIVPFVDGKLQGCTYKAVLESGYWCRFVGLDPGDEGAYGRLIRQLWRSRSTVIICEHDVVPTRAQLDSIASCEHDWCSYLYDTGEYGDSPMFGLAKMSGRMMTEHPHAAEVALVIGKRRDREAEWWRVDSLMARDLMIRRVSWHKHDPPVRHVHQGLPSGPP